MEFCGPSSLIWPSCKASNNAEMKNEKRRFLNEFEGPPGASEFQFKILVVKLANYTNIPLLTGSIPSAEMGSAHRRL
jgi:hypothetical protein